MIDRTIFRKWRGEAKAKRLEDATNVELLECLDEHLNHIIELEGELIKDGKSELSDQQIESYKCRDIVGILKRRIA